MTNPTSAHAQLDQVTKEYLDATFEMHAVTNGLTVSRLYELAERTEHLSESELETNFSEVWSEFKEILGDEHPIVFLMRLNALDHRYSRARQRYCEIRKLMTDLGAL